LPTIFNGFRRREDPVEKGPGNRIGGGNRTGDRTGLASKGFDVAFHYNKSAEAAKQGSQEAATHGVKSIALQADITKPEQAKSLVETAAEKLGGLSSKCCTAVLTILGKTDLMRTHEVPKVKAVLDTLSNLSLFE